MTTGSLFIVLASVLVGWVIGTVLAHLIAVYLMWRR